MDFTPRPEERVFLQAIVDNPGDDALWLILADWLEEHDDSRRAELLRLHRWLLTTCCEPEQHPERAGWQTRLVELLSDGVRPWVPRWRRELGGGVAMVFAGLPPGKFLMGSPANERRASTELRHRVTLSRGFCMGVTPVTQRQWQALMESNPSRFQGADRPVEQVSWQDCQEFCRKLANQDGHRYGLPTEAEWEYACRAGTTTPFCWGETLSTTQANYDGNFPYDQCSKGVWREESTVVGSFPPNAWGLFDLHGNVSEWCQDWYGEDYYRSANNKDPEGPANGPGRVLRGGSWHHPAWSCRAATRNWLEPASRHYGMGFRVRLRLDSCALGLPGS
jgi:uncharacterized protein (TIGR02996 family)